MQPRPLVVDVLDGNASVRHQAGQLRDAPRAIADRCREAHESHVRRQAAIDDASEHRRVDVASAQWQDDLQKQVTKQTIQCTNNSGRGRGRGGRERFSRGLSRLVCVLRTSHVACLLGELGE